MSKWKEAYRTVSENGNIALMETWRWVCECGEEGVEEEEFDAVEAAAKHAQSKSCYYSGVKMSEVRCDPGEHVRYIRTRDDAYVTYDEKHQRISAYATLSEAREAVEEALTVLGGGMMHLPDQSIIPVGLKAQEILAGFELNKEAVEAYKKTLPRYSLDRQREIATKLLILDNSYEYEDYSEESFYGRKGRFAPTSYLRFGRVMDDGIEWDIVDSYTHDSWCEFFTTFEQLDADEPLDQYLADQKAQEEAWEKEQKEREAAVERETYERLREKFEGQND